MMGRASSRIENSNQEDCKKVTKGGASSEKRRPWHKDDFTDLVFSWSLEGIFNENLYKDQVEKIPVSFESVEQYLCSYVYPLMEETRTELASSMEIINRAPFAKVVSLQDENPSGKLFYDVKVDFWRNRLIDLGRELYRILPGDILVISDAKPESVSDLQRVNCRWNFASVTGIAEDEAEDSNTSTQFKTKSSVTQFKIKSSIDIAVKFGEQKPLYVVFLMNITTNKRIWNTLHMMKNMKIIKKTLCPSTSAAESCDFCPAHRGVQLDENIGSGPEFELNESQTTAIVTSLLRVKCNHKSHVEVIWGPPGTGKTRTIGVMLFALLRMNYRILSCSPTNVAIKEVAFRVIKLVRESFNDESAKGDLLCPLGDILLFGNKDRLKVGSDIEEVFLEYRVDRLLECLVPLNGWKHCIASMVDLLEDSVSHYHMYVENELIKKREQRDQDKVLEDEPRSFLDFTRDRFKAVFSSLRSCMIILCTHVPRGFILEENFQNMVHLIGLLDFLERLLFQDTVSSDQLEELFSHKGIAVMDDSSKAIESTSSLLYVRNVRNQCLSVLKVLHKSLEELRFPYVVDKNDKSPIINFCFKMASLIFCTASSSFKLHSVAMEPLSLLVIDEAAQLKESESIIPLQLEGLKHAILVGDECQLPATIISKVSAEAGFGRSLFERLSLLGHSKHLLNVQYRMHPSISRFPNSNFYSNKILDAPNVRSKSYERSYLPGKMFGPYSFINVADGREERDDNEYSLRNMVEVAAVTKIVWKLYNAWNGSKTSLSIGVISPYAAQVAVMQDKLRQKYENLDGFVVKVKSIDGFQGGEEDIIIISSVRANNDGFIGFLSSPSRTNVGLTRARHCLWILGNERTLAHRQSVWKELIHDTKCRGCFFNADEDSDISKAILKMKKKLNHLDDLLNADSILFKKEKWKVSFSDIFRKSFAKLKSTHKRKSVINLLLKLASGWRPKKKSVDLVCESSSQIVKQFKVEGLYVLCSIDIVKDLGYMQVIKVWDILPNLEDIQKLVRRLDSIFYTYADDFINRCKEKCLDGELEVPKTWPVSSNIIRYKSLNDDNLFSDSSDKLEGRSYAENSRVSESFLLTKFYSLSTGAVNCLLSDGNGEELDMPFEVTDEEREIIQFDRSSFILGRSGTGKTTVLTRKLFQKEQIHHLALEGFTAAETIRAPGVDMGTNFDDSLEDTKGIVLRQLFVTVSPKLCFAVKQHVSRLKIFACGGNYLSDSSSFDAEDMDDIEEFKDIADSFVGIPASKYPLVITFHKFLMMLDGTVGDSYFERFQEIRDSLKDDNTSTRSVALQTFLRRKEVNYDRFYFSYWPRFNAQLTKKFDPSRVFTEIISHIKGAMSGKTPDSKLSRQEYILLSNNSASTLNAQMREGIYDIFQAYEKMKVKRGEFDLADFVLNLHLRLKNKGLDGDKMDFVYIDEVQDLTMRQIFLFKYICKNVDDGFVFSGDTAQTIARGIDFRFEDIRCLFYNEFVMESKNESSSVRKEKGIITEVFNLQQNFRTHAGVLRLAQSVIDLLYHFFRQSVDVLKPETSLIDGEAPILLEPGSNENAIITIFGNNENAGGKISGFGAEQVILVRDDSARKEISGYVRNQALVLTIVECKGLEFQDVLLYNYFGSSTLRNQWRVIYEFMKEKDLLDSCLLQCFPSFSHARHGILCSELKQLYVAVTRTRQRLWICENFDEFAKPMVDYWKKLCLVQGKMVDDSLAQAMQVSSSPAEWKARGLKLYREKSYEMAATCFEKAGDTNWEKRAKAAGLRAAADRMHDSNPKKACTILREAAEIFDSIGRAESAAECFYDLGDYERAGTIYLEKCGKSALKKAGECFTLARCYELAAEVYAEGNYIPECLSVCSKGKLFHLGFQYIESWKQCSTSGSGRTRRSKEIDKIKQDFLERCALSYYEVKDNKNMMKYVRAFFSMESRRNFLKSRDCLDELLLLEEESGNFKEAAEIAKLRGDILLEANLLGKAGHHKEASLLALSYVLSMSLWAAGSRGWPLKPFSRKEEILKKAASFAEQVSDEFHELVGREVKVLSDDYINLPALAELLSFSQQHKSLRVELLCMRKILDAHLHLEIVKYEWEDELLVDPKKHADGCISWDQVSVGTLMYFWNLWKENMLNIFQYLESIKTQQFSKYIGVGELCLNYFGVRRQFNNLNVTYALLNPDAEWIKRDRKSMQQNKNLLFIDARQFSSAGRIHIRAEIISVGLKVLEILEALYNFSMTNSLSLFCKSICLVNIYQVTKFLNESFENNDSVRSKLQSFLGLSTRYFEHVFPLDCGEALVDNMLSLRETVFSHNLLEEVIIRDISAKGELTNGQIGRVMMIWLGSGKPRADVYKKIAERFDENLSWKAFIQILYGHKQLESLGESPSKDSVNKCLDSESMEIFSDYHNSVLEGGCLDLSASDLVVEAPMKVSLTEMFHTALVDTYGANWRVEDYMSPNCFLYLVERLLILVCHSRDIFFTTKCSFVEWFMYRQSDTYQNASFVSDTKLSAQSTFDFVLMMVQDFLHGSQETAEWIARSNINFDHYFPLLVLRLVVIMCLLCMNSGMYFEVLSELLGQIHISSKLPRKFIEALRHGRKHNHGTIDWNIIAEAFKRTGNPVVIVRLREDSPTILCPNAISIDMGMNPSKEDIMRILFPKNTNSHCQVTQGKQQLRWTLFEDILDLLKSAENRKATDLTRISADILKIKVELEESINFLATGLNSKKPRPGESINVWREASSVLSALKQLPSLLDCSNDSLAKNIKGTRELLKNIQSRRTVVETFLTVPKDEHRTSDNGNDLSPAAASGSQSNDQSKSAESNKGKGKNKNKSKKAKGGRRKYIYGHYYADYSVGPLGVDTWGTTGAIPEGEWLMNPPQPAIPVVAPTGWARDAWAGDEGWESTTGWAGDAWDVVEEGWESTAGWAGDEGWE